MFPTQAPTTAQSTEDITPTPTATTTTTATSTGIMKKTSGRRPPPPKKPLSTYFIFRNEVFANIKREHPEMTMIEIANMIGERFRSLSESERRRYRDESLLQKIRYIQEVEAWEEQYGSVNQHDDDPFHEFTEESVRRKKIDEINKKKRREALKRKRNERDMTLNETRISAVVADLKEDNEDEEQEQEVEEEAKVAKEQEKKSSFARNSGTAVGVASMMTDEERATPAGSSKKENAQKESQSTGFGEEELLQGSQKSSKRVRVMQGKGQIAGSSGVTTRSAWQRISSQSQSQGEQL